MDTRQIVHREEFNVSPEELFSILVAPSAIREWWDADRAIVIAQPDGLWAAAWGTDEDDPDYIASATIREFQPPTKMVLGDYRYFASTGPLPFEADFTTEFLVETTAGGASLQVTQRGFPLSPEADDYYAGCQTGWKDTFAGIRRFDRRAS